MSALNNLGIKVTLPGVDANTGADQQLAFSSSWPILKQEGDPIITPQDITLGPSAEVTYAHNLGYPPLFLTAVKTTVTDPPISQYEQIGQVDSTNLYIPPGGGAGGDEDLKTWIYRLNLEQNYTSPIKQTSFRQPNRFINSFGIKALKEGRTDITSTDLRDYTIHSGARTPLIHMVSYGALEPINGGAGGYGRTISHGLPYAPLYLVFTKIIDYTLIGADPSDNGRWNIQGEVGSGGVVSLQATDTTITFKSSVNAYECTFVVFKDPFNAADGNNVEVVV